MSENRSKSDGYILRFPDGLRDEIKAAALMNDRSMNAEIVARLSGTQANLRDQIAMAALRETYPASFQDVAKRAYAIADAMLAERAKGGA